MDQFAPVFTEQIELPGGHRVGVPGAELGAVGADEVEEERGIGRVILGPAGREGFPIAGERLGIDGIEHEKVVLHQRVDDGAAPLFDGDGHGAALEPGPELGHPAMEDVRLLLRSRCSTAPPAAACSCTVCCWSPQSSPIYAATSSSCRIGFLPCERGKGRLARTRARPIVES